MKNAQSHRVSFVVSGGMEKLGVIFGALKGEGIDVSVEPVGINVVEARRRKMKRGVNGVFESALEFLATKKRGDVIGVQLGSELSKFLAKKGHSATSVSPISTKLARAKKIVRTERGQARIL